MLPDCANVSLAHNCNNKRIYPDNMHATPYFHLILPPCIVTAPCPAAYLASSKGAWLRHCSADLAGRQILVKPGIATPSVVYLVHVNSTPASCTQRQEAITGM